MSRRSAVHTSPVAVATLFVVGCVARIFLAGLGVFESGRAFITHRDDA